jgi:HD-GYP domain-containing protein (c-di-GMP phosphodiesterase class II)
MRFIRTDALKPGMILDADIIGPRGELLLAKGQVLSLSQITRLMAADFEGAYITDEYPEDEPLVEGIISRKLKENTVNALSTFFKTVNRGNPRGTLQAFDKLRHYLDEIIDEISSDKNVTANIVDLKVYDDYTYYHCVNVAALSIMVGVAADLNRHGLYKLGMGAILHDLGKIFIPKQIISKPGPLTSAEYEQMKDHCRLGSDYLRKNWEIPVESIIGVLTHHERCDGSGYPYGLPLSKQTTEGKLIAICDVYDAMTSERPYRAALSPSEVIEHIIGNSGTMFDPKMISCFIKKIAPYPVGSRVLLSNGMKATVIKNYPKGLTRPMVAADRPVIIAGSPEKQVLDLYNDPSLLNVTIIGLEGKSKDTLESEIN